MKSVFLQMPSSGVKPAPVLRQTPGSSGVWKGYQFFVDEVPKVCDYLVVFAGTSGVPRVSLSKDSTLFIAGEPPSIKKYSESYLAQFGAVISPDPELRHPKNRLTQQGHPWFCGRKFVAQGKGLPVKGYDDYQAEKSIPKTKLMSVVCSDKQSRPGHRKRFEFVQRLKEVFGDQLDLFGTGQNLIEDKADAIRPYQYHIAIENSAYPHYWTEKLSDCYLEESFPIYAGCSNIDEYFSEDAFATISLNDFDGAVEVIRSVIKRDQYSQSVQALHTAKMQVLNEYNFFNVMTNFFDSIDIDCAQKHEDFTAYPAKYFQKNAFYQCLYRMGYFFKR